MFFLLAQHALASGLLTDAVTELDAPANEQFEMSEMFVPVVTALSHLNLEESVMVCFALWPLSLGLMATLRVLTGATKHAAFDAAIDAEAGAGVAAVAASMHLDLKKSTSSMTTCVSKVARSAIRTLHSLAGKGSRLSTPLKIPPVASLPCGDPHSAGGAANRRVAKVARHALR